MMMTAEYSAFMGGKIVGICEAVLNGEIGVIVGSRILCKLHSELRGQPGWFQDDEDFLTFFGINSETDHLPVDAERCNWSTEALQRKDKEIANAEAIYRDRAITACKTLIARFDIMRGM